MGGCACQRCHKVLQRQRHGNARLAMLASAPPTSSRVCRSMPSPRRHRLVTTLGVPGSHTACCHASAAAGRLGLPAHTGSRGDGSTGRRAARYHCHLLLAAVTACASAALGRRGSSLADAYGCSAFTTPPRTLLTSARLANRHVMVAAAHCGTDVDVDTDLDGQDRVRPTVRQLEWRQPWQTLSRSDDLACCGGIDGIAPQR
jgi:hypothetical protein